jgi:hypothetical protein
MNRRIVTACTAAIVFAIGAAISAQTPAATASKDQAQSITVTGCLQSEPAPTGTAGGATASSAGSFKLTNAMMGAAAAGAGTATSGTTGTTGAGASASASKGTSYVLEGQAAELKKHVDHQVTITGKLASSAGASATGAAGASSAPAAKITVESVKMVSASCSK